MSKTNLNRILAVAPSSRGFGFAVLEGKNNLVDWGLKIERSGKAIQSLSNFGDLLLIYEPDALVLENMSGKSGHYPRTVRLYHQIQNLASREKIAIKVIQRKELMEAFLPDIGGTRHDVATVIAARLPDHLAFDLPPKRKTWDSENPRIAVFMAVALALMP